MNPAERIAEISGRLFQRAFVAGEGTHDRRIAAEVRRGSWIRLTRGVYTYAANYAGWQPDERHLAKAIATSWEARVRSPVFSRSTAAVILGLPGYGMGRERVHVALPVDSRVHSTRHVHRHEVKLAESDVVEVGGLLCTSLSRTLVDVARFATTEQAAVMLDAGMRRLCEGEHAECETEWREAQLYELARKRGERGVALARARLAFADQRSDSVAESLSRLQLRRLGYEVDLQVELRGPGRSTYRVDFELLGRKTFGEVDGEEKYTNPMLRGSHSVEEVLLAEKQREDWIRGSTGFGVVRWDFATSRSARALGERLRAFHVPPP